MLSSLACRLALLVACFFVSPLCSGAAALRRMEWKVGDATREAFVVAPDSAAAAPAPLVFVFHGLGGDARNIARAFSLHEAWPEAIVVYPQGLPIVLRPADQRAPRPGWQVVAGQAGNRDLAFFDAMLAGLRRDFRVDDRRIFSTGHSNGGYLSYLLWAERGEVLAAIAPSAGAAPALLARRTSPPPRPVFHAGSRVDQIVPFAQQQAAIARAREINGCAATAEPWAEGCELYRSEKGAPVVVFTHDGGHAFPRAAVPLVVRFFKEHARPASAR